MRIGYLLFICAIFASNNVFAIFKCIDESGKVSYQAKRCPEKPTSDSDSIDESQKDKPNSSAIKFFDVSIPGNSISVPLPSDWEVNITRPNDRDVPTLKAEPKSGAGLTLLMTPMPLKESLSAEDKKAFLKQISSKTRMKYHSYGTTKELDSTPIQQEMTGSIGHLYTFADEKLLNMETLPEGESIYANTGAIIIGNILVTTTILTNDLDTDNYQRALAAIHFTSSAAKKDSFSVKLKNPNVVIDIPELPAIKLDKHPLSAAKPHLRLLGNMDPYNVSVMTPTADEGMTAAECATSSGGSIAEQYGLDKSKISLMEAEDNHTFGMYFPLSFSEIRQGMYQLNAYLFSAHAGTHCIMVHISRVSMDKDVITKWLKGFPQARIRSY